MACLLALKAGGSPASKQCRLPISVSSHTAAAAVQVLSVDTVQSWGGEELYSVHYCSPLVCGKQENLVQTVAATAAI